MEAVKSGKNKIRPCNCVDGLFELRGFGVLYLLLWLECGGRRKRCSQHLTHHVECVALIRRSV